jgi:predicted nucleotidyltransferase
MGHKEILTILRAEKPFLQERFGLLSIGLFGSYAQDKEGPDSDIDLLVELVEPRFDHLAGLQVYLEERLGKPVELVRKRKGMNPRFLQRVERGIRYA